jgi:hypothetical protein
MNFVVTYRRGREEVENERDVGVEARHGGR